jgi:hypothetical protein
VSFRILQLSPQASTRFTRRRVVIQQGWSAPSDSSMEAGFLQTWFESNGDLQDSSASGTNWGAIYGLALSVALSASFWAGVAWIVARVWR